MPVAVNSVYTTNNINAGIFAGSKPWSVVNLGKYRLVPSVAEWSKALESDASGGGESPVRAPVRAATLCPYV